jgi:hypothetical protein
MGDEAMTIPPVFMPNKPVANVADRNSVVTSETM